VSSCSARETCLRIASHRQWRMWLRHRYIQCETNSPYRWSRWTHGEFSSVRLPTQGTTCFT
jgi:hypothetical protein